MQNLPGLDYRPTEYRLEWMEIAERDIEESKRYLELLIAEVRPDVLHFSQYCYGDLATNIPKVVVAHSDIVSWWAAVHGSEPDDTPWMRSYRETVSRGLRGADMVVAPSRWMLDQVSKFYFHPAAEQVIYNGRSPMLFDPNNKKDDSVLSVGRVWDAAKNVSLLMQREQESRIAIVGWEREPGREDRQRSVPTPANVSLLGPKSQAELRDMYSRAGTYAATSRYEPFGLAPLEAALSRCALVMNDNPVFHELWDDAAVFFKKDDSEDCARQIDQLSRDPGLRKEYADRAFQVACEKFTASRMLEQYQHAYQELLSRVRVA
jgi:glycosyltransferase involved in cell wall biosynthesis